jgi:hypothetical protein
MITVYLMSLVCCVVCGLALICSFDGVDNYGCAYAFSILSPFNNGSHVCLLMSSMCSDIRDSLITDKFTSVCLFSVVICGNCRYNGRL